MSFINYEPTKGITITTYRNNGVACENEEEFIDSLIKKEAATVSTDDPQDFIRTCIYALEDGEALLNAGYTDDNEEAVNNAHEILSNAEGENL